MDVFPPTFSVVNVVIFIVACLFAGTAILVHQLGLFDVLFSKVDRTSKRYGGELVAATLKQHGVKFVFTLIGGHISPIIVACEKEGIRVVDTRHEVTCVFAADAVARLSGVIGVACVTAGPGLTNTVTAVKNAQMAESPVLLLGGAAANLLKGRGALQDIDQMALFKPLCKFCATIGRVKDIVPTLRKAIAIAQSDTPGPVFVEFPVDTLYQIELVTKELASKNPPRTLSQRFTAWYINMYIDRLYSGAWDPQDMSPLPVRQPITSPKEIQNCVLLLKSAKKPLILIGSQATLPPTNSEDLKAALERMGVPCFLGGMSRGLLGRNSPLHIRQKRRDALKEADVVVLAGTVCDFRLTYGRVLSSRSKIIAVNRNKTSLNLNAGAMWNAAIAVLGDPGSFLVSLSRALEGYSFDPEWPRQLKSRDKEREAENWEKACAVPEKHLNSLKVLHLAEKVMSEKTIMVADGGDFVGSAAYILRPRGPLCWLDPGAFGTLGVGGGFALGAKLCRPESDVWIIYGDGSLGYSIAEFDTFTRHQLPVIALIGNDACWTQIARDQIPILGSSAGCMLAYTDYEVAAKGFGGHGYRLARENTDEEIEQTLHEAQELSRKGKPVLVNCLIGKTTFRDGSLSM